MTCHSTPLMFSEAEMRGAWPWQEFAPNSFDLIMADPPWRFELRSAKGEEKSAQAQYRTMTLDEIKALPVAGLASENCLLWLWATAPMLDQQIEVLKAWGFTFKTSGVWVKRTVNDKVHFGTGYIFRNAHEPVLIGTRGDPKTAKNVRSVVMGRVRNHSQKPDEAFRAAEHLMPDARRVELFSRTNRKGWSAWGDEVGKFDLPLTVADPSAEALGPPPLGRAKRVAQSRLRTASEYSTEGE